MKIGIVKAKVIEISDPVTGTSQKGQWIKYMLKLQGEMKWDFFSVSLFNPVQLPELNQENSFELSVKGNEYNGKIYNEINAKLIVEHKQELTPQEYKSGQTSTPMQQADMLYKPTEQQLKMKMQQKESEPTFDDLPF